MKISKVKAELKGQDILSIINEFVKVEGLSLSKVDIDNEIKIEGAFKKGVSFDFEGILTIEGVKDGKVYCKFSKFKILKLGLFRIMRSYALKTAIKHLAVSGIENYKDIVILDIHKILNPVPYVDLDISEVYIKKNMLMVEVAEVNISIKGGLIKDEEVEEVLTEEEEVLEFPIEKVKDVYTVGRKIMEDKLPEKARIASDIVFILPDVLALICRLLKDNRVPMKTKLIISASLGYVVFPVDIIPKKIPFIGSVDELAVAFFALNKIASTVPTKVIAENWEGKNELVLVLKKGVEYLVGFTNARNVDKLYSVISELSTL
ncbi:YkvA family protein [Clostridium sp. SHJSY1]|uniref:YkvA family protein n=1 Tax=Clostridium sp. SHJSY1 TaxID=2942483 RepID=UPI002874F835|nr:YkvA family protein [Clostridium sp. SHJSY1]MDS0525082.1 YkvA family protein [Clostridium sp. SHJSY1]